jgi:hypothetical protein
MAPKTKQFCRVISASNSARAAKQKASKLERTCISAKKCVFGSLHPSRVDEEEFFGSVTRARKQRAGVSKDRQLLPEAIVRAAFEADPRDAKMLTGLKDRSVARAPAVVSDMLASLSNDKIEGLLSSPHPFLVVKRASDETPLRCKEAGSSGQVVPIKVLNTEFHMRWGRGHHCRSRVPVMGIELHATDGVGLIEGLERALPSTSVRWLKEGKRHCPYRPPVS